MNLENKPQNIRDTQESTTTSIIYLHKKENLSIFNMFFQARTQIRELRKNVSKLTDEEK